MFPLAYRGCQAKMKQPFVKRVETLDQKVGDENPALTPGSVARRLALCGYNVLYEVIIAWRQFRFCACRR